MNLSKLFIQEIALVVTFICIQGCGSAPENADPTSGGDQKARIEKVVSKSAAAIVEKLNLLTSREDQSRILVNLFLTEVPLLSLSEDRNLEQVQAKLVSLIRYKCPSTGTEKCTFILNF